MGINNAFTFKDVTLSFLIDIKNGGVIFGTEPRVLCTALVHMLAAESRGDGETVIEGVKASWVVHPTTFRL